MNWIRNILELALHTVGQKGIYALVSKLNEHTTLSLPLGVNKSGVSSPIYCPLQSKLARGNRQPKARSLESPAILLASERASVLIFFRFLQEV